MLAAGDEGGDEDEDMADLVDEGCSGGASDADADELADELADDDVEAAAGSKRKKSTSKVRRTNAVRGHTAVWLGCRAHFLQTYNKV